MVAAYLYVFAPQSPEKSRWYTEEEVKLAKIRLEQDSQDRDDTFRWEDAKKQLKHWPTWAYASMALMYGVGVASSSNFLPVSAISLSVNRQLVLTIPVIDHDQTTYD